MTVTVQKLNERAKLPTYGSAEAAGADLYALIEGELVIPPGETVLIHTGIALALERGTVGLVFARSGLATKRNLAPANKVGVIDSDYRGEIMVPLHNHGKTPEGILDGERIAQLMVVPCLMPAFLEGEIENDTERGTAGFGSTGSR